MSMKEIGTKPSDESSKVSCRLSDLKRSAVVPNTDRLRFSFLLQAVLNLQPVDGQPLTTDQAQSLYTRFSSREAAVRRIISGGEDADVVERTPELDALNEI